MQVNLQNIRRSQGSSSGEVLSRGRERTDAEHWPLLALGSIDEEGTRQRARLTGTNTHLSKLTDQYT